MVEKKIKKNGSFDLGRNVYLILFLILVVGLGLRIARISVGQQPVFADEAIYIRWAQIMKTEPTLRFLPLSDGKQPLFMWVLMFLLQPALDPLVLGRSLSAITGLLTNVGIFVLSYRLFGSKKVSLTASGIYALMPMAVLFDSMALVDSMLAMFGVWAFVFAIEAVRRVRADLAMLSGFSLGGALLTKSPALFYSILLPATSVFAFSKFKDIRKKKLLNVLGIFIPVLTIGYAMYNIMRLGPNFHLISSRNSDYIFPPSHLWEKPLDPLVPHLVDVVSWFWTIGPGVILILFAMGVLWGIRHHKKETLYLAALGLIPLVVNSLYAKVFTVRYILFVVPYIIILSALFIGTTRRLKIQIFLIALYSITALCVNYKLIFNIEKAPLPKSERTGYLENWTAGYGILEAASYLREYQRKNPTEKIVVGTEGYFGTLPDGLQMYLNNFPEITVIGVGIDIKDLPLQLAESRDFGSTTFFVVNQSRLLADPADLGLKLIASYDKPLRTKNTHEYVRYGPQDSLLFFEVK